MDAESVVFVDGVNEEMADLLDGLEQNARAMPGDEIGDIGGIKMRHRKNSSMVHRNGVELPERTKVYDALGRPSLVPTAQLQYHLSKRTIGGERAFYSRPPQGVPEQEFIEDTCEWCLKRTAGKVRKRFEDIDAMEAHFEAFHPREYANKLRREERDNKAMDATTILRLISGLTPEQREALIGGMPA